MDVRFFEHVAGVFPGSGAAAAFSGMIFHAANGGRPFRGIGGSMGSFGPLSPASLPYGLYGGMQSNRVSDYHHRAGMMLSSSHGAPGRSHLALMSASGGSNAISSSTSGAGVFSIDCLLTPGGASGGVCSPGGEGMLSGRGSPNGYRIRRMSDSGDKSGTNWFFQCFYTILDIMNVLKRMCQTAKTLIISLCDPLLK